MASKVTLQLIVDDKQVKPAAQSVTSELRKIGVVAQAAGVESARGLNMMAREAQFAGASIRAVFGAYAVRQAASLLTTITNTTTQMQRYSAALQFATGSQAAANRELDYIRGVAERLGVSLNSLVKGYTDLASAARAANLDGEATRHIFEGIVTAARAMALSGDQINGALVAVQQMLSKGVVSMEELRQQLGDRIPGAVQIMANALDVSVQDLAKMVSSGTVPATDALMKFSDELLRLSANSIEFASQQPYAQFERLKTSIFEATAALGGSGFNDAMGQAAISMRDFIDSLRDDGTIEALGASMSWLVSNIDQLLIAYTLLKVGQAAYLAQMKLTDPAVKDARVAAQAQAQAQIAQAAANMQVVGAEAAKASAMAKSAMASRNSAAANVAEARTTLASAEAAMAQSLLNQELARTGLTRARANDQVRASMLSLQKAQAALINAGNLEKLAIDRLNVAKTKELQLNAALIASGTTLKAVVDANAAANSRWAAAKALNIAAGERLVTWGRSAFAMIGGWPTILLAVGYAGYQMWDGLVSGSQAAQDAISRSEQRIKSLSSTLTELRAQLNRVPESAVKTVVAISDLDTAIHLASQRFEVGTHISNESSIAFLNWATNVIHGAYVTRQATKDLELLNAQRNEEIRNSLNVAAATDQLNAAQGKSSQNLVNSVDALLRYGETMEDLMATLETIGLAQAYVNGLFNRVPPSAQVATAAIQQIDGESQKLIDKMVEERETLGLTRAERLMYNAGLEATALAKQAATAKTAEEVEALNRAAAAIQEEAQRTALAIIANESMTEARKKSVQAANDADEAAKKLASSQKEFGIELVKMAADQMPEADKALALHSLELARLSERHASGEISAQQLTAAVRLQEQAYNATARAIAKKNDENLREADIVGRLKQDYLDEISLIGLSNEQHRVEETYLRVIRTERERLLDMAPAERAAEEARIRATIEWGVAAIMAKEKVEETARAWEKFAYGLAEAVLDGSKGVKRYFKQLLDDLKKQIIASGLMTLFRSLFNIGGAQAGSGFGSMFASMFGGGRGMIGSAASGGSGLGIGSLVGSGGNLFSGLATAISGGVSSGLMGLGGTLAGMGMGGFGGGLAWAGGSFAANGLLGGLGKSFMTGLGNLFGGGSALMGIGQMIPAIAAIGAVAAAIQKISGGKLFGTKYKFESAQQQFDFTGAGFDGSASMTEVRQRSLFRGRKWRTTALDIDAETKASMEEFWNAILDANSEIARQFGRDAAIDVPASFKQEMDASGKVTAEIGTILGRQYRETWETFAKRISAENIIANIDGILGTTVPAPIFGGGGGGGGGGRRRDGDDFTIIEGGGAFPMDAIAQATGEASAIAERWRGSAEKLLDGAQFLLLAATDIHAGTGLLGEGGTLTQITDLIEDLAFAGEPLADTYTRVATSAAMLDQALALSGVELGKTREELVRFAVDITDAAGGLEQAKALWDSYFANFYSEAERAAYQRGQLRTSADAAFAGAGLDITQYLDTGGLERFRTDFEAAMPTLSAEDVANWLRAADALAAVTASARAIDAQIADGAWQQYLDGLTESERAIAEVTKYYDDWRDSLIANGATTAQLTAVEEQRAVAMGRLLAAQAEAQAQAEADYQRAVRDIADELAEAGMSEFAIQMRDIGRWTTDTTASLNAAARAAGMQAANEEDLALVHQVAAQRAAAAIAQLRAAAASLVTELFGPAAGSLDDINAQIAALEGIGGQISSGADGAGAAIDNLFQRWMSGVESVQQYLDSMLLGDLSALTPEEQLSEARRQLEAAQAAALGGDAEALARLPQLSDAYLRMVRGYEASGQDYNDQFDWVRSLLQSVVDLPNPGTAPGAPGGGGGGNYAPPTSRELEELYAQRDALLAEQEAAHRMALMEQLGGMIRELIQATGEPLADVAASIGLNLTDLASGLGINLNDMSATTASALVDMARMLGVDVAELAQNVGVSLGDLADRQSLLNQALDATLLDVPEDIRAQLEAPLEAVRNATTEADANAALAQLEDVTGDLPTGIRDLLAPYFDFLDPTPMTTELTRLSDIYDTAAAQLDAALATNDLLDRIASNLNASNTAAGLPAFASGGWVNGPTALLAGERGRELILPNPVSEFFQRAGIPINSGGGDNREVVAELRALRAEVDALRKSQERSAQSVVGAVVKTGEVSDRNNDQSRARNAQAAQRRGVTA
ncbi:MAG: tape measure protein [Anaerolineae bacterium]|nr:tape measure protein [Anaerolineae bacterium]